jgi:hypothetical protein
MLKVSKSSIQVLSNYIIISVIFVDANEQPQILVIDTEQDDSEEEEAIEVMVVTHHG